MQPPQTPPPYTPGPQPGGPTGGQQQPYPPINTPAPKRRKWPWIVGGLAALFALSCGGFFALVVGGTTAAVKNITDNQAGTNATTGKMNTPAADGSLQFTVTGMRCGVNRVGTPDLGKTAQGSYCLINVTVKNISKTPDDFTGFSQQAITGTGTQLDNDAEAETYVNPQNQTLLDTINPGNQVKGVIVFDVPEHATIIAVILHDSAFSAGVKIPVHAS